MAKPIYYPDWATQTVTLPGTLNTNKIRPKETIRTIGMDYGQIMTCEEMNWILNNIGLWIRYLVDDFLPTLPNTYLPLVGTKITMAGDATGEATWNGNKEVTLSIQVQDNSHNHLSANITDATSSTVTPNVLVKRDAGGAIYGGDVYVNGTSTTDPATLFFKNFAGQTNGEISAEYQSGGQLYIYRRNPSTGGVAAGVRLYDAGYVLIDNPRSNNGQDTSNGNALVRLDYLNSRLTSLQNTLQTNINTVQNNLNSVNSNLSSRINNVESNHQSQITNNYNYANGTFVRDIRYTSQGVYYPPGNEVSWTYICSSGYVLSGIIVQETGRSSADNIGGVYFKRLQRNVNGNWYDIGG